MTFTEIRGVCRFTFASPPRPAFEREFRFTLDDLRRDFRDGHNCPLHQALKRSGAPVSAVAGDFWLDRLGLVHWFDPKMQEASYLLSRSNNRRWTRVFMLWGSRFRYSINGGQRLSREEIGVEQVLRR